MGRTPLLRLQDMLHAIEAAYRHAGNTPRDELEADEDAYAACQFRILVVAEAAKTIPEASGRATQASNGASSSAWVIG